MSSSFRRRCTSSAWCPCPWPDRRELRATLGEIRVQLHGLRPRGRSVLVDLLQQLLLSGRRIRGRGRLLSARGRHVGGDGQIDPAAHREVGQQHVGAFLLPDDLHQDASGRSPHFSSALNSLPGWGGGRSSLPTASVYWTFGLDSLPANASRDSRRLARVEFRGSGFISMFWSCITREILVMPFLIRLHDQAVSRDLRAGGEA